MDLLSIMGVNSADDIDPHRPIEVAGLVLGEEAAREAIRLIGAGGAGKPVHCFSKPFVNDPFYWTLSRRGIAIGEAFCFPKGQLTGLPTALEIALVRAIASVTEAELLKVTDGDYLVALGEFVEIEKVCSILKCVCSPLNGHCILLNRYACIDLTESDDGQLSPVVIKCLQGSFQAMPIKFRFLELYRAMEARFLRDIRENFLNLFDAQPKVALERATKSFSSELVQMYSLAEAKKPYFEMVWSAAYTVRSTNQLAIALFKKISSHNETHNSLEKSGAALIYFLRCAIVHAGQKDIIYEAYPDGDALLELIMEHVEEASLALAGVHLT